MKRHTHLPQSNWQQQQSARLISHTLPHTFINSRWHYCVSISTKQLESAWAVDPSQRRVALGWGFGCSLWVVGFCGWGIWPCLVISLHLCFISPSSLSLSLFHKDTLTEHNYLSLSVYRLRMKSTRLPQFISSLAHICILFDKYALILVFIS